MRRNRLLLLAAAVASYTELGGVPAGAVLGLGAICQWCLGNDVVISVVAVLCVGRMLTEPGPE